MILRVPDEYYDRLVGLGLDLTLLVKAALVYGSHLSDVERATITKHFWENSKWRNWVKLLVPDEILRYGGEYDPRRGLPKYQVVIALICFFADLESEQIYTEITRL
jgi:hypothetical protein